MYFIQHTIYTYNLPKYHTNFFFSLHPYLITFIYKIPHKTKTTKLHFRINLFLYILINFFFFLQILYSYITINPIEKITSSPIKLQEITKISHEKVINIFYFNIPSLYFTFIFNWNKNNNYIHTLIIFPSISTHVF